MITRNTAMAEVLAPKVAAALAEGQSLGIVCIGMQGLRRLRIHAGYRAVDELLRQSAERLQAILRPGDEMIELGSGDYGLVLTGLKDSQHALLAAARGCLVLTTSVSGSHATPPLAAYSPSKAAQLMLMKQMAVEWGPDGIRVNALSPGLTVTPGTAAAYEHAGAREQREARIPLRRLAQAEGHERKHPGCAAVPVRALLHQRCDQRRRR